MTISWATGKGIVTASPALNYAAEEAGPTSTVMYGTSSGNYTTNTSSTIFTSYNQVYNFSNANPILNYSSPLFHHVTIQNLAPSTQYFYKVGDPKLGMSQEFNFTSPPALGASSYPFVLGVVADTGLTPNTTVTIQHLVDAKPQVWTLIGDFSYADDMQTNGTINYACIIADDPLYAAPTEESAEQLKAANWMFVSLPASIPTLCTTVRAIVHAYTCMTLSTSTVLSLPFTIVILTLVVPDASRAPASCLDDDVDQ